MTGRIGTWACSLLLLLSLSGCWTLNHTVGQGASGDIEVTHTQWYALWGLVPLGDKDSKELAGGATSYDVETQMSALDFVINIFTGFVTIYRTTITVTK